MRVIGAVDPAMKSSRDDERRPIDPQLIESETPLLFGEAGGLIEIVLLDWSTYSEDGNGAPKLNVNLELIVIATSLGLANCAMAVAAPMIVNRHTIVVGLAGAFRINDAASIDPILKFSIDDDSDPAPQLMLSATGPFFGATEGDIEIRLVDC